MNKEDYVPRYTQRDIKKATDKVALWMMGRMVAIATVTFILGVIVGALLF